jgi:hypothetical protein
MPTMSPSPLQATTPRSQVTTPRPQATTTMICHDAVRQMRVRHGILVPRERKSAGLFATSP